MYQHSVNSERPALAELDGRAAALGAVIRRLRRVQDLSQRQMALGARLSANHLGALERGEVPNVGLMSLTHIASELNVSVRGLVQAYVRGEPLTHREVVALLSSPMLGLAGDGGGLRLGAALRALRQRRMRTQQEVARRARVAEAHLGDLERGELFEPRLWTICRLGRGLAEDPCNQRAVEAIVILLVCIFAGEVRFDG